MAPYVPKNGESMKRDELTKLGMTEEQVNLVMALNGSDIEKHKSLIEQQQSAINELKQELAQTSEKLVQNESELLNTQSKALEQADKKVLEFCFEHSLNEQLRTHGVKDIKAVKAHLNMEELSYDEQTSEVIGLNSQLEHVKNNCAFLFNENNFMPEFCQSTMGATKTRPAHNSEANSAIRAFFGKDY